jgi:RNA polymerase sigma factor (sigma-70 family)
MPREDTAMGAGHGQFPGTHLSVLTRLRDSSDEIRNLGWGSLVELYWKPVYKYIRIQWNKSNEDAKDLTQAFFMRAMEKRFFDSYDPLKSRFRTFVRTCLDGFVANEEKASRAIKRGGSSMLLSLDFPSAEKELAQIAADDTPNRMFEKEWIRNLFTTGLQILRKNCEAQHKWKQFQIFERHDIDPDPDHPPTYKDLADEFGISITDATNYLAWARREFRQIILEKIRESTATDEEYRSEARQILGIKIP